MIETSEALALLLSRKSHNKLVLPAPTEQQLKIMFKAALRAPDHAQLKPWRYRVYQGEALLQLASIFVQASTTADPSISPEKAQKIEAKAMRAPLVVVASVCLVEHPKVPEIEQILSSGASVQNLLMAAHFQGVGAIWRTGELAFNSHLGELLDFAENEIVTGFIYLGTEIGVKREAKIPQIEDFVTQFT